MHANKISTHKAHNVTLKKGGAPRSEVSTPRRAVR